MTDPRAVIDAWRDRRTTPLAFTLDGDEYVVPDHPARVWVLAVLSSDSVDWLLDVLPQEDADYLWEAVEDPDDELTEDHLRRIGKALLGQVTGRPWWQVTQLVAELVFQWDTFIAVARDRALGDPLEWPLEDLCAWVYLRLTQHAKPEVKTRIDASLAHPPMDSAEIDGDGDEAPEGWDEAAGWMSVAARYGAGAPPT